MLDSGVEDPADNGKCRRESLPLVGQALDYAFLRISQMILFDLYREDIVVRILAVLVPVVSLKWTIVRAAAANPMTC